LPSESHTVENVVNDKGSANEPDGLLDNLGSELAQTMCTISASKLKKSSALYFLTLKET